MAKKKETKEVVENEKENKIIEEDGFTHKVDLKKLDKSFSDLKKKYEKSFISLEGNGGRISRYPINSFSFAYVLGNGIPKGRIIELFGEESNGKTLCSILMATMIQKLYNGFVIMLDYEFSFDKDFFESLGLDTSPEKFQLFQPETLEEGFDILENCAKSHQVSFAIFDSTAAAKTLREDESDYGSANMGSSARGYSGGLKKIVGHLSESGMTVCFISQIRATMDQYHPRAIGCGKAMAFYASIRIEVKRSEYIFDEENSKERVGMKIKLINIKNKTYTPFKTAEISFFFKTGIDVIRETVGFAIKYNIIKKSGSFYSVPTIEKSIQGQESVVLLLKQPDKKELYDAIRKDLEKVLFQDIKKEQQTFSPGETKGYEEVSDDIK